MTLRKIEEALHFPISTTLSYLLSRPECTSCILQRNDPLRLSFILPLHPSHARGRQFIHEKPKIVGEVPFRRWYERCRRLIGHDGRPNVIPSVGLRARWTVRFHHALYDSVDVTGWNEVVLPNLRAPENNLFEEFVVLKLFYLCSEFLHNYRNELSCGGGGGQMGSE